MSLSLQTREKISHSDFTPTVKGDLIIIFLILKLHISTHGAAIVILQASTVYQIYKYIYLYINIYAAKLKYISFKRTA